MAPMQGYTDCVYRRAHCECAGGVDEYYTPFVRLEGGAPRQKDMRDIMPERNAGVPTAVQVIARDADEFARLCDAVQAAGWSRIDLNLGCPFPMQVRAGRGCGLMLHPDRVTAVADEMRRRPEVLFSAKMRLGQDDTAQGMALVPALNEMPLLHLTVHPRLGIQQYKGTVDRGAFAGLMQALRHPVVYNGDLLSRDGIETLLAEFPNLKGVMLGRGLLARPWLFSEAGRSEVLRAMHRQVYLHACQTLCGDAQVLARMHAFWEYAATAPDEDAVLDRKQLKALLKSRDRRRYDEAVAAVWRNGVR